MRARRCYILFLASCLVLALEVRPAASQCDEFFDAAVTNMDSVGGNLFGCPTSDNTGSPDCGITYRFYTDNPAGGGLINYALDGNPIFSTRGNGAYRTDLGHSQPYHGIQCGLPMYCLWDVQIDGGTANHRGYYGAQSQIIENDETGNIFGECGGIRSVSCFAALAGEEALTVPDAPLGPIEPIGGLAPIPVPIFRGGDYHRAFIEWVEPANWHRTAAAGGDPGTSPNPILGILLYLYESTGSIGSVTDADLDAHARFYGFFPSGQTWTEIFWSELDIETVEYLPAIKVAYVQSGGQVVMESIHWSANGSVVSRYDVDGDGVPNTGDNCPYYPNTDQADADQDGLGDACDVCPFDAENDADGDGHCADWDNCPAMDNPEQQDDDADGWGTVCDNCPLMANPSQHDLDDDTEGDECDEDDGILFFRRIDDLRLRWQPDPAFWHFNLYRGSLAVLRSGGPHTQEPGSNPYAGRYCDLGETQLDDSLAPEHGESLYWLVTGEGSGGESGLGDGAHTERSHGSPCP